MCKDIWFSLFIIAVQGDFLPNKWGIALTREIRQVVSTGTLCDYVLMVSFKSFFVLKPFLFLPCASLSYVAYR